MDNLLQALINADRVCREAHEYFERANNMEIQNHNAMLRSIKRLKFLAIILGLVLAWICVAGMNDNADFMLLTTLCVICLYFYLKGLLKKKHEKKSEQQCGAERLQGQNILEANKNALAFLPSDYWYPLATNFMLKAVQAGRATTLPEAIDKFEEQLHRWKLEESNAQILAQQQAQSQQLASIAKDIEGVRFGW